MKPIKIIGVAVVAIAMLLPSCSIEKRRYRKGYNIESGAKNEKPVDIADKQMEPGNPETLPEIDQSASSSAVILPINTTYTFYVKVGPRPDQKKVNAKHKPHN